MLSALVSSLRLSLFASRRKTKLVRPRSATAYTHSPSMWRTGLRNAQGKKAKAPRKRPAKAVFDSPKWPSSCAQIEATSSSECRLRRRSEKNRSRLYGNAKAAAAGLLSSHTRGLDMFSPRVWLLKSPAAAAFALPYSRDLFFSERLLSLHSDDEVASICAHELGHLGESKTALAGRFLGALAFLPWAFLKPVRHMLGEWVYAVALLGLTSFIFLRLAKRLSRRLEIRADSIAQANEGQSGTYARALARLYEENLLPAVLPRRRHTHPDLYDRLLAVGVQPDYQRPEPPNPATYPGILLMLLFVILIMLRFIYKFG